MGRDAAVEEDEILTAESSRVRRVRRWLLPVLILAGGLLSWTRAEVIRVREVSALRTGSAAQRWHACEDIIEERRAMVRELTKLVEDDHDTAAEGTRHAAIRLLGDLRAEDAVYCLVEHLDFAPEGVGANPHTPEYYPCAWALVKIGLPASRQIAERGIYSDSVDARQLAAWVMMKVEGREGAIRRLQEQIAKDRAGEWQSEAILYIRHFQQQYGPPVKPTKPTP